MQKLEEVYDIHPLTEEEKKELEEFGLIPYTHRYLDFFRNPFTTQYWVINSILISGCLYGRLVTKKWKVLNSAAIVALLGQAYLDRNKIFYRNLITYPDDDDM